MIEPWIKMRCNLATDEAVIGIAAATNLDPDTVVGKLHRLWSWADRQSHDGHVHNVTPEWIDRHVGSVTGFAQAMVEQGWLRFDERGVSFPKFNEHMSGLAKKRASDAKRQSRHRHASCVTSSSSSSLSSSMSSKGGVGGKRQAQQALTIYQAYPKHKSKQAALRAIAKALKTVEYDTLLERTQTFAKSVESKKGTEDWQYVPYPATWFNRGGWEDEVDPKAEENPFLVGLTPDE
jgi:hypothetical protein